MRTLWKDLLFLHGHVAHPAVLEPADDRSLASRLPPTVADAAPRRPAPADADAPLPWRECA